MGPILFCYHPVSEDERTISHAPIKTGALTFVDFTRLVEGGGRYLLTGGSFIAQSEPSEKAGELYHPRCSAFGRVLAGGLKKSSKKIGVQSLEVESEVLSSATEVLMLGPAPYDHREAKNGEDPNGLTIRLHIHLRDPHRRSNKIIYEP